MNNSSLNQYATYWAITGVGVAGDPTFGDPVRISCRWESVNEIAHGAGGEEFKISSSVFVDIDLIIGSYLYLGESEEDDPTDQENARLIQGFSSIPDLSGLDFERRALL